MSHVTHTINMSQPWMRALPFSIGCNTFSVRLLLRNLKWTLFDDLAASRWERHMEWEGENDSEEEGGRKWEREWKREFEGKKRERAREREQYEKRDSARARARAREREKATKGERDLSENLMLIDGLVHRHYSVLLLLHSSCTESKGERDLSDWKPLFEQITATHQNM